MNSADFFAALRCAGATKLRLARQAQQTDLSLRTNCWPRNCSRLNTCAQLTTPAPPA